MVGNRSFRHVLTTAVIGGMVVAGSPVLAPGAAQADPAGRAGNAASDLRLGVVAVAGAISAVGQVPELAEPLPFTSTSAADLLGLDTSLASELDGALSATDLKAALGSIEGVEVLDGTPADTISFTYERTTPAGTTLPLTLDDGDLRFAGGSAGAVSVDLRTTSPFVVRVDPTQTEELLRVALVSKPVLDLSVSVTTPQVGAFKARQGFTAIDVTGGHYRATRSRTITMRDPDGRSQLTLEDLRYSTLPDLFLVEPGPAAAQDDLDVELDVALPSTLSGGTGRTGSLSLSDADITGDVVWPAAADAHRAYGAALTQATGLTMVDGLTSLSQYTGTVLALQEAADVPFPHLGGGTSDLFAPGDRLLDLLSTAASAQVVCGASPDNPPTGIAAPGDAVYCQATTPQDLGTLSGISWTPKSGNGRIDPATPAPDTALGATPSGVVKIVESDGEPDLQVTFTGTVGTGASAESTSYTARTTPRTVQDVVRRINELTGSTASATLTADRLDVSVAIRQASATADLELGSASTVGALVGITGLRSPDPANPAKAEATATASRFDVGFGIQTGDLAADQTRGTYLLPTDEPLLQIGGLAARAPSTVTGLDARIGFLGVKADLTTLELGKAGTGPAVTLTRVARPGTTTPLSAPLLISELLNADGAIDPQQLDLTSDVTAAIGFRATEQPLVAGGSDYATGGQAQGTATVRWNPTGRPRVETSGQYDALRVFDPVPARFLTGTTDVTPGAAGEATDADDKADTVTVTLPSGTNLYEALNVADPGAPAAGQPRQTVEVARRLVADDVACQNVVVLNATTLTCEGLAPNGDAAVADDQPIEMIVLGDPFALRDSVIDGLATTLSEFDTLTGDNVPGAEPAFDQYSSTLPLVDLTPAQLAVERQALAQGIAEIQAAATADEQVKKPGSLHTPVSSAQELSTAVRTLVTVGTESASRYGAALDYTLGTESLGIRLSAQAPASLPTAVVKAPLRLDDLGSTQKPGRGLVQSGKLGDTQQTVPVQVTSTTTLAIDVDRATARPTVAAGTGTESKARVTAGPGNLATHPLQAGIADLEVTGPGSKAALDVDVHTTYDATAKLLKTSRTPGDTAANAPPAASATLVISPTDTIEFSAPATASSGGAGAVTPAPDAMEVAYLAEGLDGLAAALDSSMDGAAPRNLAGNDGAPISAPLIGTDLDAGAGVPDILTTLTSSLRDQLAETDVAGATTKAALETALVPAFKDAVTATRRPDGAAAITASDVTASVACTASPCTDDSPTGWDLVEVHAELKGLLRDAQRPFETGLAGLEVRSNKPINTRTEWTLPVTLQLKRGVGPQIAIGQGDRLRTTVTAELPVKAATADTPERAEIDAIVGYLPARLTADPGPDSTVRTVVVAEPAPDTYNLFQLYDGDLTATPSFEDVGGETGLDLTFATLARDKGVLGLDGTIHLPWDAAEMFHEEVTYDDVTLDVGQVISTIATPFQVVDPYLAPVRDVVDVLRSPIPVVSDLSELGGGDEVSLLSLLETLAKATRKPQLEMAHRVIGLVGGVTDMISALAPLAKQKVPLADLQAAGELLSIDPSDVELKSKCTQKVTTTTTTTTPGGPPTTVKKVAPPVPCPDDDALAEDGDAPGAPGQTTADNRKGNRRVSEQVGTKTVEVTGQLPGFSLPFLTDPDQILDMLTGEGEASYFRLDLGSLTASVAYNQSFGPIMAGPIPIKPFVGGSISVEGRLAVGFDSYPQTLAAQAVAPGDVDGLLAAYAGFDDGNVIREAFYIDDLDSDGVDVPEVQVVTTLEAGAGISIGIVTAGLKGAVTLTINLDLNDPNDDGRLRVAEIRDQFANRAECIFDASATIGASISIFVEIELLFTSLEYEYEILSLGPYTIFEYGCPDEIPTLVKPVYDGNGNGTGLVLTSGGLSSERQTGGTDVADEFEVRQFDKGDNTDGDPVTVYEIGGFGRVQTVSVVQTAADNFNVTINKSGATTSTEAQDTFSTKARPTFQADGGANKDKISFLAGEEYEDTTDGPELKATPFDTAIASLTGGAEDDVLVTGDGNDRDVRGGDGNDTIDTGLGNDSADGEGGNDIVGGGAGNDDLRGGEGTDRLEGGPGADRLYGGAGDDSILGGTGRDVRAVLVQTRVPAAGEVAQQVRLGFDSGDVLVGGAGTDTVDGGDGSDVVVGGEATDLTDPATSLSSMLVDRPRTVKVLVPGATNPTPQSVDVPTVTVPTDIDALCVSGDPESGTPTSDYVTGGAESDVVIGGNGSDSLDGGSGPDQLCGRAGDDQITGDGAQDSPDSNDVIRGGAGDDRVDGGVGDDVLFGDDVTLRRGGTLHLDGSLGGTGSGDGDDFLDGGVGDDVVAGGAGSDLLVGSDGDDSAYGEGRDTSDSGPAPADGERLLDCNTTTRVVGGLVDLNSDFVAGDTGFTVDTGQLAGLDVVNGEIRLPGTTTALRGLIGGEVVVDGKVDLDGDGAITAADTGMVDLPSMLGTGDNSDGDCVLAGDGNDDLRGGTGSDYLGAGAGTDLVVGGNGNDLLLGDDGTDLLVGGTHSDVLVGGLGDDHLAGGSGDDRLRGNEGADDLVGGSGTSGAADGQDLLLGGRQDDVLVAENGVAVSTSIATAISDPAVPWDATGLVPDAVTTPVSGDPRLASSALVCGSAPATRFLTLLADDGSPGTPVASPGTPGADGAVYDELYGGFGCDFVFGSIGNDLVRGGQDDDVVEAGRGKDVVYGDDGSDVLVGGSSVDPTTSTLVTRDRTGGSNQDDLGDTIHGDGGPDGARGDGADLVAGDNALPVRVEALASTDPDAAAPYVLTLYDVASTTSSPRAATAGGDTVDAGRLTDRVFGQGGGDTIAGDADDDYLEGNDGADTITGGTGQDDLLGGSSSTGRPLGTLADGGTRLHDVLDGPFDASAAGLLDDGSDTIDGNDGDDLVLGDNGRITRPVALLRLVARADETGTTGVSDGDDLSGGDGLDRLFGQGGDDVVDGDDGTDHVEGNEGDDTLTGGRDSDTVIGGSSLSPDNRRTLDDAVALARTQRDGGDTIDGDDPTLPDVASDVVLGDNGTVLVAGGVTTVQLADVATTTSTPAAGTSGNDVISGGIPGLGRPGASDRILGQGGKDTISTGPADDYLEGGADNDLITTDAGNDDVLGGSSALDGRPFGTDGARLTSNGGTAPDPAGPRLLDGTDVVDTGTGDDVVVGDNGFLTRPSGASATRANGTRLRSVLLYDVVTATRSVPAGVGGGDVVTAGDGRDLVFGQAGNDRTYAGTGDDYVEGNVGDDDLRGESGEDDVLGGGSTNTGAVITVSGSTVTDRLLTPVTVATDLSAAGMVDGNDTIDGGDARDVVLGDNGRVTRDGAGVRLAGGASGVHVVRQVAMADQAPGVWAGSDALSGGLGDDDLYGQFDSTRTSRPKQVYANQPVQGDILSGGGGDDAIIGDQGVDRPTPAAALGAVNRSITDSGRFINELVRPSGTLVRVVTLSQTTLGGDDLVLGDAGSDSIHTGRGKDVVNAGAGDDVVFGGDDSDALWGGTGHDRIFGGAGTDLLDIKRRTSDIRLWQVVAPVEDTDRRRRTVNGRDVLYGGSGADAMQADQGDAGTTRKLQGDRLIDWSRSINYSKVCQSGYGAGRVLNVSSSSMVSTLRALALATGSVGSAELAIPSAERLTTYANTGSFVCETR